MTEKRYFIYGHGQCPFCIMACDYLSALKKEHFFFDYQSDPAMLKELKEFYKHPTFPMILENDIESGKTIFVGGYTELLDNLND